MASCPARRREKIRLAPVRRKHGERGTAMVEFVLSTSLLIVPLFLGLIAVGLSLVLANQVTEVCRDVGHMYAYNVDFSQPASQLLVTNQLAQNLNLTASGGKGVIYMSTLTHLDGTSCTGAGLLANSGNCPNINQTVVIKRVVIGNPAIRASSFAPSITDGIINASGNIGSAAYLTDASVRASAFDNVISLNVGQYAYATETFVQPPAAGLWSLFGANVVAARAVF